MNNEEDILQAKCTQWFHNTFHALRGTMFAIPNGGKRDRITANLLKATGVRRGIADIVWLRPGAVIFVEMKTPVGQMSEDQKKFKKRCDEYGHIYVLLRTFEDFVEYITSILSLEKD